jgi:hypothetical protein
MLLKDLKKKEIKQISSDIAPKLMPHPAFMFYCKSEQDRLKFIEDYFNHYLKKWNNTEIILTNENHDAIITLIDIFAFAEKEKGLGASSIKKYKNPYANISFHRKNVSYLANIIAPATVDTKIMTIYSTLKYTDESNKLVDEAIKLSEENNFMLVYETFSKKSVEILTEKGFETAYEKRFSTTQYFETIMTYYRHDALTPVKLIEEFKPIVIDEEPGETAENAQKEDAEYPENK